MATLDARVRCLAWCLLGLLALPLVAGCDGPEPGPRDPNASTARADQAIRSAP